MRRMYRVRYQRQNRPENGSFGANLPDQVISVPPCAFGASSTMPR